MGRMAKYGALAAGAAAMGYPFLWMLLTSFKSLREANTPSVLGLPEQWLWRNYIDTFQSAPFGRYFFNTFFVAGATTIAVVFTALLAGYAFARLDFRGKPALFTLTLATMMIPFEVTLIPNFMLISELGW